MQKRFHCFLLDNFHIASGILEIRFGHTDSTALDVIAVKVVKDI